MTMAVDSMAIRKVAGLGSAPDLSAFSAMVHIISADRYKLFLRLGIGDGALPKCAEMRQKAPFFQTDWPGWVTFEQTGAYRASLFRVPKLVQFTIETRLQPVASQGLECLEHEVDAREEEQSDSDDRQERGQSDEPVVGAWHRSPGSGSFPRMW